MAVITKARRAGIRAAKLHKEARHDAKRVRRELALKRKVPDAVIEARRREYLRSHSARLKELLGLHPVPRTPS
jgi:hypothetical protein